MPTLDLLTRASNPRRVDVFDIELNESDPEKLVEVIAALEPTFGGINLEVVLILPNIDAANISYNFLKAAAGNNVAIGPILLGAAKPVHVLTESATVRRIVNVAALLVAEAGDHHLSGPGGYGITVVQSVYSEYAASAGVRIPHGIRAEGSARS